MFVPNELGIPLTNGIGLCPVFINWLSSNNSVLLKYNSPETCDKKSSINSYVKTVQYVSYAVLIVSAIPAKIVGL